MSQIQKERPAILYLHPYEVDEKKYPEYFYEALSSLPFRKRIPLSLYRLNKHTVGGKLRRLLDEYNFLPMNNVIDNYMASGNLKITSF